MSSNIEQISLRDMIDTLFKYKKLIFISILLFVILASVYSLLLTKPKVTVLTKFDVKQVEGAESSFSIDPSLNSMIVPSNSSNILYSDVLFKSESKPEALNIDTLIAKYRDGLANNEHLLKEIKKISNDYQLLESPSLPLIIDINKTPDSNDLTIKVTANSSETGVKLAELVNKDFQSFIETENFELLFNKLTSTKHQLRFNIDLLKTKINQLEKELASIDKTITYKPSIIEPNPSYVMYVQNLTSNKIALNNAQSQFTEIQKVENNLLTIAKETGLTVIQDQPIIEDSSSLLRNLVKNLILASMIGFLFAGFIAFFREFWIRTSK